MMGKSVFFSERTGGQMKSAPSFAKDDDSTLPKELNGSKIGLGPKPIWGMSADSLSTERTTPAAVKATRMALSAAAPNNLNRRRLRSSHIWKANFQLSQLMGKSPVRQRPP